MLILSKTDSLEEVAIQLAHEACGGAQNWEKIILGWGDKHKQNMNKYNMGIVESTSVLRPFAGSLIKSI